MEDQREEVNLKNLIGNLAIAGILGNTIYDSPFRDLYIAAIKFNELEEADKRLEQKVSYSFPSWTLEDKQMESYQIEDKMGIPEKVHKAVPYSEVEELFSKTIELLKFYQERI
jgi:hypothetical protein